ncbi:MAG: DUF3857 domain-containing protein, partial [Cyclobacteriaceae bacterium]|nr:DUF3857 domain-containing protein [Cyclobacteriaceae bacterium]
MLWVRTSLQGLICLLLFLQNLNAQIKTTKVPSWVIKQSYDTQGQNEELESGYLFLLLNEQEKYADKHQYFEYAYKILNTEGIQEMSDISISFDPSYENIEFHSIKIIRSNIEINQIPENFNIIQRETSAERHL